LLLVVTTHAVGQTLQFSAADLAPDSKTDLESKFNLFEITRFEPVDEDGAVLLRNGYAKHTITNPQAWKELMQHNRATEVNLIYTKYPRNKDLWRTNYRGLMMNRLKALFALDSTLNSGTVEWNIVLQTECATEPEAMLMPHGIEIVYEPLESPVAESVGEDSVPAESVAKIPTANDPKLKAAERKLSKMLKRFSASSDSTVQTVLNRNTRWQNALVVMDWTGSMYEFSIKTMLWHAQNFDRSGLTNMTLFTDGTPNQKKGRMGNYGGVVSTSMENLKTLTQVMQRAVFFNYRNDIPENNIEALIKGIAAFPNSSEVIMIADNRSCMKDYCLCELVNVPVHVVLCGSKDGINPQYVNLAYRTGGSIHTLDSDIQGFDGYTVSGKELVIDGWPFTFNEATGLFEEKDHERGTPYGYQVCEDYYKQSAKCKKYLKQHRAGN